MTIIYDKLSKIGSNKILNKVAIIESNGNKIRYKELLELIRIQSKNLSKLGKKLTYGIILDNSISSISLFFAVSKLNSSLVVIDKDIAVSQLLKYRRSINIDAIIISKKIRNKFKFIKIPNLFFIEDINKKKKLKFIKVNKNSRKNLFFISSFSSGTTSEPKPIFYTEKCKFLRSMQSKKLFKINSNDKLICYSPIHHSLAQRIAFLSLLNHSTLVLMKRFNYFSYINLIEKYKINILFPISSHLSLIYNYFKKSNILSYIKLVIASSADASANIKRKLFLVLKNKFVEIYGLSELAIVSILQYEDVRKGYLKSVGKTCQNVNLKILKVEKKNKFKKGEILCYSNLISKFKNLEKNNKKIFYNNLYKTGDVGYLKNKYLYLSGRKKEIIIKSGVNIFPVDIQTEILKEKNITNCIVIGIKDNFFGEVPIAICETKYRNIKSLEKNIKEIIYKNLSKTQYPHKYIFLNKLKQLKTGKVDKLYYKSRYKNIKLPNLLSLFIN